jgi:glucose/arabinose dehydrogenase
MSRAAPLVAIASLGPAVLAACSGPEPLPPQAGFGPNPVLPPPQATMVSTVNIAPAVGWTDGQQPHAAKGFAVGALADGFDHPRWLYVLPNGDVLVAETNKPPKGT